MGDYGLWVIAITTVLSTRIYLSNYTKLLIFNEFDIRDSLCQCLITKYSQLQNKIRKLDLVCCEYQLIFPAET